MDYEIIKTGSKGNAVIIDDYILIDCGVNFLDLKKYYSKIKIAFITHKHSDHFKIRTIKTLVSRRPNLKFFVADYLVEELLNCEVPKKNIVVLETGKLYDFGSFKCKLDKIPHDVPNVAIHIHKGIEKLIYATDTNSLENVKAIRYNYYLIEGNYKEEELQKRKEEHIQNGEFVIENRIENSHLSFEKCVDYFMRSCADYSVLEVMHQHEDRNTD